MSKLLVFALWLALACACGGAALPCDQPYHCPKGKMAIDCMPPNPHIIQGSADGFDPRMCSDECFQYVSKSCPGVSLVF